MEENQEQKKRKKGIIDYANEGINKGRNAYNAYGKAQSAVRFVRGAQTAAGAAEAGTSAAASIEIWGPILVIILLILLIVGIVIAIFGGGPQAATPSCTDLTATADTISPGEPVTLTLSGCTGTPTFSWTTPDVGGTIVPPDGQTVTYTAPTTIASETTFVITVSVCSSTNATLCTQNSIELTISPTDCGSQNGSCIFANTCIPANDLQKISGTCTDVGTVCCAAATAVTCANVDQRLLNDFGVKVDPVTESVSCTVKKRIYKIYSIPFQSPTYVKNLKPGTPFTLEFYAGSYGRASGYTPSGYTIQLTGFASFISNSSWFDLASFLLQHETGHLIKHRNYTKFYTNFPYATLLSRDASCFNSCRVIKTYSLCPSPLYNRSSETMAEITALYAYNSKTGNNGTISNFRTQCNDSYTYIRSALYGGTTVNP